VKEVEFEQEQLPGVDQLFQFETIDEVLLTMRATGQSAHYEPGQITFGITSEDGKTMWIGAFWLIQNSMEHLRVTWVFMPKPSENEEVEDDFGFDQIIKID
jgi:hypothetical protein